MAENTSKEMLFKLHYLAIKSQKSNKVSYQESEIRKRALSEISLSLNTKYKQQLSFEKLKSRGLYSDKMKFIERNTTKERKIRTEIKRAIGSHDSVKISIDEA